MGDIGVEVEDPQGKNTVELLVEDKGNQVYRCVYKPMHPGPHVVKVTFAGDTIPKSPFVVQVGEGECGVADQVCCLCTWPGLKARRMVMELLCPLSVANGSLCPQDTNIFP